jgi:FrmR/RcnR family transcriptional regulator, repressor of frmRAB operon
MTHTVREKQKLLARVRRIRGQVEGIERALDSEVGCEQIMHLIAGARGALGGLMAEVIEDHVREHLVDAAKYPGALNAEAAEQLLDVVRTYLK